ncbi:MAG: MBL fold metallo-hydrolase [Gammaproteobacteria bacterium]|nr:MBL fold metallo-hydrolase [Gammaproteobacteria bacterium]MBT8051272.1 MBL fold metallo-hydrolase [Gammaproteobacteria bacterium]NNJ80543.1 MBL fold metallo-hydrolase [Xanthomonadales bacterium]NNK32712.1 MBL fold metallo-hydrolase [Xanthomonadales bacterium]
MEDRPDSGAALELAPGILWLRLSLPFQLNHINVWLLREDEGWALVDTGLFTNTTREVWKNVLERVLRGVPLTRVLVTHLHPDHVGCAGWLARRFGVDVWMSRTEYLLCRILVADTGKPAPEAGTRFYRAAGFPPEAMQHYSEHFGGFGRVVSPLPESYRRIGEGDRVQIGSDEWRVIVGRGHSPEHACLYNAERNLLIAGDQILPTISSNVSVYPTEPEANPLQDWFDSISRLAGELPADVLVLPAHGRPFTGAHHRLAQLRDEHEAGLVKLRELCREPRRALDVFPALFKSRIDDRNLIMATGEALSHLHYLEATGEAQRSRGSDGVDWWRAT